MNVNTSFQDLKPHPITWDGVATEASQRQSDMRAINADCARLNRYLDALGVSEDERVRIRRLAEEQLSDRKTGEASLRPVVWLAGQAHALLDSHLPAEARSERGADVNQAFLEWRIQARLSRGSAVPNASFGTVAGKTELKSITQAPAIARTSMPTARIEHNFAHRLAQFIVGRVSVLRAFAAQTYRRLTVGV